MIPINKPARSLIITHGAIGLELKNVVEMILGPTDGLDAMTNSGKAGPEITSDIVSWLEEGDSDPEPSSCLILIDDYAGSCATSAQFASRGRENVAIISGVNLAMILGFVTWRESSDFDELVRKVVQKGREAITMLGVR